MTPEEAEKRIIEAGGKPEDFWEWMGGQTVGLNGDGTTEIYAGDVQRFIGYGCNPANEPLSEWD